MTSITLRPISVKLEEGLRERIKGLADARRRTTHWLMREAIQQYVEREAQRETLRQATLQAWQEYQTTGLHVSGEEADTWLAKLSEGQDVEPPQCHR